MLNDRDLQYADIQACCACLGFREGTTYKIDPDAEASIRALLRYLRNESTQCDVRRELGRLRIVSSDLIPLLRSCTANKTLTELVVRLLMNLTQPAIVCFRQEVPKDRDLYGVYVQVDDILKSYKKDFADEELFRTLCNIISELFDRKWEERSEEDRLLIERILILTRNVLHIAPDPTFEKRTDEDVSVHDQLLWAMHLSGWDELLLFLGNAEDEQMFAFHTLEIISLMLREQTPEMLASAGDRTHQSKMDQLSERRWLLESSEKRRFLYDHTSRQNRFGGTFELLNTPSLTNHPLIYHHDIMSPASLNPYSGSGLSSSVNADIEDNLDVVDLDVDKRKFRKPKNRKPIIERPVHRRSVLAVRLHLQRFCWNFLQFCYNPLMRSARASLTRHSTQENDETYYLWSLRFFTAFCRLYKFRSAYLSETLDVSTFHWIYDQVMNYRELILSDKRGGGTNRRAVYASRRLDLAVAAYREFLTCLGRMIRVEPADRIPDFQLNETQESVEEQMRVQANAAETIMANIFYVSEYQEVYPMLLRDYNEAIQSREYLKNLIEGAHLFIGLLSDRIKNGNQKLLVRRTRVVRAKRHQRPHRSEPKATSEDDDEEPPELKAMRLQCQWESQLMLPLVDLLQNPANENGTSSEEEADEDGSRLFDAVSGSSEAKQLRSAVRRVQAALYAGHPHTALRLARRMWRLWPEVAPVSVNDEDPIFQDARSASLTPASVAVLSSLHKIHSTELEEEMEENEVQDDEDALNASVDDLYNEELGASDPEEGGVVVEKEETIDLNAFLLKFAHPQIVHAYTLLLADYASNSTFTNTALVHTIHRLAVRQKLPGSFFQLRLFYVFQRFIHDRTLSNSPEFKDLANLAKYILRKFFETLQKNPSVVVELLFFKSIKESFEVSKGYGTFDDSRKTIQWTEEQDDELTKLFEAYRHEPVSHGEDLADVLRKHFSDPSKTRRQIIARLITLGLVASLKQLKQLTVRSKVPRAPRLSRGGNESDKAEWTEEEILHLRSLFENHENSKTLLSDIMTDLTMDHELALRRQQQSEEDGTAEYEKISVPLLRPRRAVSAKMLELGLVTDKKSLGRNPRKRAPKSNLVSIDNNGSISVLRRPPKRQRRRKSSSSSEELGFGSDESEASFSDEGIASSPASVDRQSDSEELELGVTNEANLREADIEQPLVGTLPARSESGSDSEDRLEIVTQDLHSVSLESNQNTTEKLHRSGAISEEEFEDLPAEPKQMGKRRLLHLDSSSDDDLEDGALHVDTTGDIVPPETITISREDRVESSNLPDEDLPAEPKQMGKRRLLHLDSSSDDDSEDGALHVDTTGDIVPPETITISREDRVESSNLPDEDLPAEPKQMGKRRLLHLDSSSDDDSEDGALHVDTTGDIVPPETITISREDRVESSNLPEL